MRNFGFILMVLFVLIASCRQKSRTDDPGKLKQVLIDYFDGIKSRDLKKLNEVTTGDFILYEDGLVWNNDSLMNALNAYKKFSADYRFSNFSIHVENASGDMIYFNHGNFIINDTTEISKDWIESATFRKVDGKWKLKFLHSSVKK